MTGSRALPDYAADPFGLTGEQRHHAVRVVASASHDADDCALLLSVLGLTPAEGRPPADDAPPGSPRAETPRPHRRWRNSAQARRR
ncbi:hypothetical protein QRX60_32760 [Amycolatopsis mongoliensis]|uniref:Uncharacterized protein n=1 Tax=Amycolatopsis mongoliensis TaxID=715475 RepID=A0A9Y2NRE0_9PSEU|nr:hypothetical protein [Amycolatopsis sp. 4-36]WIY07665.1 hypothetical protein QRX60_32760 [Amycolatopsis sp. 4-36]